MKLSTRGRGKNFSIYDTGEGVFCTNAFAMDINHNGDYLEWDLTNPDKPVMNVQMTKDPHNHAFARAFLCYAITLFGRYETTGRDQLPVLPGRRGQGGMESPKFDLRPVAEKHGYPCKATEMPPTMCYLDADIPGDMNMNRLVDLYFQFIPGADGMNDNISPNASRHLNVQVQCGRGATNIEGAHAGGWSGADEIMALVIGGKRAVVGYKHETHMGNSFPILSLDFGDIKAVRADLVVKAVIENWDEVAHACDLSDMNLFGVTKETLKASWIDSPHIGCEVLGGAVGSIAFERFGIELVADEIAAQEPAPTPAQKQHPTVMIDGVEYVPK